MKLIYFTEREKLDNFVKSCSAGVLSGGAEFLQSWEWGEVIIRGGEEIIRVGVQEDGKILAAATLIKKVLRCGLFYWYAPRGPIIGEGSEEEKRAIENFLFSEIEKINQRAVFIRIEPLIEAHAALTAGKKKFKIKKSLDLQPRETLILDLEKGEKELLADMNQKTRYNIRLAEKKGVTIKPGTLKDAAEFWRLMNLTGNRDRFRLHEPEHYENLISADHDFIRLFLAEYQGRNIAAGLFCFWGDKVTYMHGASDNECRNIMAPHLLQWSVIKQAAAEAYKYYDFYGISEKKWPGVTRFKLGFGGRRVNYAGTSDLVLRPLLYSVYDLFRRLRRLI